MEEFYIAHQQVTEGKPRFLIPILLEDVPLDDLPQDLQTYLRTYTYIDAREYDIDTLRKRIRFAMSDTPYKVLEAQQHEHQDNTGELLDDMELQNNEQDAEVGDEQNVERAEAEGGILRLLLADGTILEQPFPKKLQNESEDEGEEDCKYGDEEQDTEEDNYDTNYYYYYYYY